MLMPMAVAAGALGFLLILSLTHTAPRLLDTSVHLDLGIVGLLNRFARRSWSFDISVQEVSHSALLQGVMVALFWGAWFAPSDPFAARRKRETLLASLIGVYATVALAILLRATLPFRTRPALDPVLGFEAPYSLSPMIHSNSTSLPAGHAAVFFALAAGLWAISLALGILGFFYALVVVCLPRIYLGLHYPTDILVGAGLAILTVSSVIEILRNGPLVRHLLAWSERHPTPFYTLLFLCSLDIAMEFSSVRPFLRLLGSGHFHKLVLLAIGAAPPA